MVRIALPNKGRLYDDVIALLDHAGLPLRSHATRALTARLGPDYEAIFARAEDVPSLVADGAASLGVTGWDRVCESGRSVRSVLDLELGRCALVLATRKDTGAESAESLPAGTRVATSFPRLARGFFERLGTDVEVVPLAGAVEVAPLLGIADVVVDLTSTGSTLKTNGLRPIATLLDSTARLIAHPSVADDAIVTDLSSALASVLRARSQRYLLANAPRARIAAVRERLPGLNGPTISELHGGGAFVAVHAVVPADDVFRSVAALRALGCEGILVMRIERSLPGASDSKGRSAIWRRAHRRSSSSANWAFR